MPTLRTFRLDNDEKGRMITRGIYHRPLGYSQSHDKHLEETHPGIVTRCTHLRQTKNTEHPRDSAEVHSVALQWVEASKRDVARASSVSCGTDVTVPA